MPRFAYPIFCTALLLVVFATFPVRAEMLDVARGEVAVIDGDSLAIGGRIIHLAGLDAPELGQTCDHGGHLWSCGMAAALELRKIVFLAGASHIQCDLKEIDKAAGKGPQMRLGICFLGDRDIGATLVTAGYADVSPNATVHYLSLKERAIEQALGVWGGTFAAPAEWRAEAAKATAVADCPFKGVRDDLGRPVFRVPLDKDYGRTASGAKRFCSDEQAVEAGYGR